MKSAFEIAMERLGEGLKELAPEQKNEIAVIESKYKAKIAEAELASEDRIRKFPDEADKIRKELAGTVASFREKCERDKEKVRAGKNGS